VAITPFSEGRTGLGQKVSFEGTATNGRIQKLKIERNQHSLCGFQTLEQRISRNKKKKLIFPSLGAGGFVGKKEKAGSGPRRAWASGKKGPKTASKKPQRWLASTKPPLCQEQERKWGGVTRSRQSAASQHRGATRKRRGGGKNFREALLIIIPLLSSSRGRSGAKKVNRERYFPIPNGLPTRKKKTA